jgi:hypothetical protein
MPPFFGNNSVLIVGNLGPVSVPELGVVITDVGRDVLLYDNNPKLVSSTVVVDALCFPDPTNKLLDSFLGFDTLCISQLRTDLLHTALCVDILCGDTF